MKLIASILSKAMKKIYPITLLYILGLEISHGSQLGTNKDKEVMATSRKSRKNRNTDQPSLFSHLHDFGCDCAWKPRDLLLPKNYNKLEIPVLEGTEYLTIAVSVLIRKLREIDELKEDMTVEIDFVASWLDMMIFEANKDVLKNRFSTGESFEKLLKTLDSDFLREIWKPDLFIENVVSISRPELILKPIKLNLGPVGTIIYSTRVTIKMDCDMEFHYYPADTQRCIFKIRSYSHTIKKLKMEWMDPTGVFIFDSDESNFDVKVGEVKVLNITEFHGLLHENYSETYEILQFTLSARRKMHFHLIQTFLPSVFFIAITWLCFLVPASMLEARIGIAMTTLLTLTSMFSSVREHTPIVSYIKAIDIWMVACIMFVFMTLVEFAVLVWLRYEGVESDETESYDAIPNTDPRGNEFSSLSISFTKRLYLRHRQREDRKMIKSCQNAAILIEDYAFVVFFVSFFIFNICFWPWLLLASEHLDWVVDPKYNVLDK